MSQFHPPHQGSPYTPPAQGGPPAYAGHPAYVGYPVPQPQSSGLNPWVAGLLGALAGAMLTFIGMTLLPILFFGLLMGGPMGDEGFMGPPASRVDVAPDGSVSGLALAEALEEGYYEDVTCPNTPKVGTDVTTICDANDGFANMRVVVVFRGTDGRFGAADLFE
ncbi:hypothetical protein N802_15520 [Knoellia sinensis KCTC 19936]|uniref:DUF4333 domain-containing protein n=1 Tax=Knoellia sinensis KCTC 19936 TaxID=1385520 RepID=A0A0A0J6R0_9MICO|nr:hypothetical protein [Knoellia sinensis]KGN33000.1 hypothetical protein N802_15520 [Knoellia sinensis KCTC 19936]